MEQRGFHILAAAGIGRVYGSCILSCCCRSAGLDQSSSLSANFLLFPNEIGRQFLGDAVKHENLLKNVDLATKILWTWKDVDGSHIVFFRFESDDTRPILL